MNKKVLKSLKITGNVIFYLIIVVLLMFSVANIRKKDKGSFANLFGKGFLTVESESMKGEGKDNFSIGDLIVVKKATDKKIANLKVGDIITFYDASLAAKDDGSLSSYLNTHRIVYINTQGKNPLYVTQGDYNRSVFGAYLEPIYNSEGKLINEDEFRQVNSILDASDAYEEVSGENIKGIYSSHSTAWGKILTTINNNFFACVVLPVIILFLFELIIVILNIVNLKNERHKEALAIDGDIQKEELRKQILEEMSASQKEELKKQILEELEKEKEDKN